MSTNRRLLVVVAAAVAAAMVTTSTYSIAEEVQSGESGIELTIDRELSPVVETILPEALIRTLRVLAANSRPIQDIKELQRRFGISQERASAIFIGEEGKRNVIDDLQADPTPPARFDCTEFSCTCHGDDDCNLMFETVCASRLTNGSCTGSTCTCRPLCC
jgi:hypothetical protein